jgi:hypothetical protein
MQLQMGIDITVQENMEIVRSLPNFLSSDNRLSPTFAMRLVSVLCGYRLVDVLAFIGGAHPLEKFVERTPAPTAPLPVRVFCLCGLFLDTTELQF